MPEIEIFGTMVNVPAQVCGLIGLVIIVAGYQQKKVRLLVFQLVGCFFCLAESLMLGGWIGAVVTVCGIIRNTLIIGFLLKKDKELPPQLTAALILLMWLGCLPFYLFAGEAADWFNFLPPALLTISTVCAAHRNFYVLKAGALAHESGFLFYQLGIGAYIGAVRQIVLALAVLISIVIMIIRDRKGVRIKR